MSAIYDIAGTSNDTFMINGKATFIQGTINPKNYQGKDGDLYLQSGVEDDPLQVATVWIKKDGNWVDMANNALPVSSSENKNEFLISLGDGSYGFAKLKYVDGAISTEVPAGEEGNALYARMAGNDHFRIRVGGDQDEGWIELATADNYREPIYVRQYQGNYSTVKNELILLDENGYTHLAKIPVASSATDSTQVPSIGWINDSTKSTNVVHRDSAETLSGDKTFSGTTTFSGDITSSGSNTFSGTNNFTGTLTAKIPSASSSTSSKNVATVGWVNDPTKSTNVVHRTGNETINGVKTFSQTINGTALQAMWADLAEYYEADNDYPAGTLMTFGGDKEVTIATNDCNAVVSTNPAVIMNGNQSFEHPCPIALVGRVPVRVIGKVNKFDYLQLSDIPGVAISIPDEEFNFSNVIARALENKDSEEEGLVLCVVKFEL